MRIMSIVVTLAMTLLSGPAWGGGDNLLPDPGAHSHDAAPETLNVQFHWLDRSPSAEERAVMERAGRSWASRIRAYPIEYRSSIVGPLTLTQAGYYLYDGHRVPYTRYVEIDHGVRIDPADRLLILIDDEWTSDVSTGMAHRWRIDPATGAYWPWLGVVRLTQAARQDLQTATHEIGHVLGLGTAPGYHALVRESPGHKGSFVFVGSHAVAANGGEPVPLEHGHTGPCPSVMSYRHCAQGGPSDLDFAMLADLGYHILDPQTAAEPLDTKTRVDRIRTTAADRTRSMRSTGARVREPK